MSLASRRRFLEDSILATAAAAMVPSRVVSAAPESRSPNERVNVAIIGCGIRGKQHAAELAKLPDCHVAYVCDPDLYRADEVAQQLVGLKRPQPQAVRDLRTVYDDPRIDAVFIATCNHWHALAAIWAMQAGKDAYVEKPVSHTVSEGRRIVQVARKTNRICQGGTQNRSSGPMAAAIEYLQQGKLGDVNLARSVVYGRRSSIGSSSPCAVPTTVDLNLWAGPASVAPPRRPKFHYDWHWVWDTGNGELGNNNIHSLDICRWGLGLNGLGRSVLSYGGRLGYQDAGETPNTQVCIFDFGAKTVVAETRGLKSAPFHPQVNAMWIFYGSEGMIAGTSLFDPQGNLVRTFTGQGENHFANFLQAVKSRRREDLKAEILEGHQSTALCHLGNISWRLGRVADAAEIRSQLMELAVRDNVLDTFERTEKHLRDNEVNLAQTPLTLGPLLRLHAEREAFIDHPQADALLSREYRRPFVVPAESQI